MHHISCHSSLNKSLTAQKSNEALAVVLLYFCRQFSPKMNSYSRISIIAAFLGLLIYSGNSSAAGGYEIKVRLKELPSTDFYLANYYIKNHYYKDTATSDSKGLVTFSGTENLEQGMYSLVMGTRKIFDFFVIEQKIYFETDTSNTIGNMIVKGSRENELFYEYMKFLRTKENEVRPLQEKSRNGSEDEKKEAAVRLDAIDKEVDKYIRNFIEVNKSYFVARFIQGMRDVDIPPAPRDENGAVTDSNFQYRYFRQHYFDHIDFSDARYLRTPVYHQKLSAWLQTYTYQIADSLYPAIDLVVDKARANKELFRFTVSWITNTYEESKIMGMDAIFIHMAEKYYLTGEADWIDSAQYAKIKEAYEKNKPLLIGKLAPNIVLADTTQKTWFNLHKTDAEYTLVYIWSPNCGHCKKLTPKMHDVYLKYKDHGFKVFAVSTELENTEWKKYVREHNLTWINVSDSPEHPNNIKDYPLNYRHNYDVFSTPKIYLLDKNKIIIAKRIEDEQIDQFLGRAFGIAPDKPAGDVKVDLED